MKRLFLILALALIPLTAKAADFPGGGGAAAAGAATGIDIDGDGTLEVTGVADTSVDTDPDDDGNVNMRIIDNAGGWIVQRLDTTFKNVWSVADDTGDQVFGDGTEGDVTFAMADGDIIFSNDTITLECTGSLCSFRFGDVNRMISVAGNQMSFRISGGDRFDLTNVQAVFNVPIEHDKTTGTTITEPFVCNSTKVASETYVDDDDDGLQGVMCICVDLDDGSTFDWRRSDDNGTACPFM